MLHQLSALDAFFLYGETATQAMNLSGIGIYDPSTRSEGPPTLADVIAYGEERTRRSALFRRKILKAPLGSDQPYWSEDPTFDVRNHIFHTTLRAPGPRRELDAEIARIHALTIDPARPLWEWWFIEGLGGIDGLPPGSFALLFKLHHAAFDGVSGWEVINVSHDTQPNAYKDVLTASELPAGAGSKTSAPSAVEMGIRAYQRALMTPFHLAETLWKTVPIFRKVLTSERSTFPLYAGQAPDTPLNRPVGTERCHRKVPLTLGELKRIRALVPGSTVNDAVLTIIGGALRSYLERAGKLPEASLNVGVPISIRAAGDEGDAGNQAVLSILPLGTDIADHVERLRALHERTSARKQYVGTIPAHVLADYLEFVPGVAMDAAVQAFTRLRVASASPVAFNLIVTNVPASRVPIYFAGARMLEYDAAGPIWDGAGLVHAVTSYLDTVNISFFAAAALMTDPDGYEQAISAVIAELKEVAGSAPR